MPFFKNLKIQKSNVKNLKKGFGLDQNYLDWAEKTIWDF